MGGGGEGGEGGGAETMRPTIKLIIYIANSIIRIQSFKFTFS